VADATDSDAGIDMIDGSLTAHNLVAATATNSLATITMIGKHTDTSGRGDVIIGQTGEAEMLLSSSRTHKRILAVARDNGDSFVEITDGLIQRDQGFLIGMDKDAFGAVDQSGGTTRIGGNLSLTGTSANAPALYLLGRGTLDLIGGNALLNPGFADFRFFGGRLLDVSVLGVAMDNDGGTLAPGGSMETTTILGGIQSKLGALRSRRGRNVPRFRRCDRPRQRVAGRRTLSHRIVAFSNNP